MCGPGPPPNLSGSSLSTFIWDTEATHCVVSFGARYALAASVGVIFFAPLAGAFLHRFGYWVAAWQGQWRDL